jgi:radical SAM superfamily enzyme YgiQ (UPF0313 family)
LPESISQVEGVSPPLGILYIAAVLGDAGYKVDILDSLALDLTPEETKDAIRRYNPDIVGITCMTPTLPSALEVAKLTKEVSENIITVLGGVHLSVFPSETINFPYIDFGIQGEGEYTFLDLVRYIEQKSGSFEHINGLIWKHNKKIIVNQESPPIQDLDRLPFPARHLLSTHLYGSIIMPRPMTTLIAARGCPFKCAFCFRDKYGRIYRMRSPENVVDEIEHCIEAFGIKYLAFYDDCWPNKQFLRNICKEIIDRGIDIQWETPQRVDLVDPELLKLMKEAGCTRLRYGVESGSPRILKLMQKNITLDKVRKVFKWTRDERIETFAYFIIGYPTETYDEFRSTIELAKEISPDWAMFNVAVPLPNTLMWRQAVEDFGFDPEYWRELSMGLRNDSLPYFTPNADRLCSHAYREFYFRLNFIFKKMTGIRSWQNLKRYLMGVRALLLFKMRD